MRAYVGYGFWKKSEAYGLKTGAPAGGPGVRAPLLLRGGGAPICSTIHLVTPGSRARCRRLAELHVYAPKGIPFGATGCDGSCSRGSRPSALVVGTQHVSALAGSAWTVPQPKAVATWPMRALSAFWLPGTASQARICGLGIGLNGWSATSHEPPATRPSLPGSVLSSIETNGSDFHTSVGLPGVAGPGPPSPRPHDTASLLGREG